jgi:hypothetical protein
VLQLGPTAHKQCWSKNKGPGGLILKLQNIAGNLFVAITIKKSLSSEALFYFTNRMLFKVPAK